MIKLSVEKIRRTISFIWRHPLAKKHRFRALLRFFLWQIESASSSGLIIKPFIKNIKFYARKGLTGITGNIYSGLHEFNDMGFLLHFLRPGDIFFDIGANVGSYTLLASGICRAMSFTLEPVPATFKLLKKNIDLNALEKNVILINACAGSSRGYINFSSKADTTNHVLAANEVMDSNVINVPVITIDSLLDDGHPVLVKIDVEGFETEVFKAMEKTLALHSLKAIIVELNSSGARYGYNELDIHNLLLLNNFKPYRYDPFKRRLVELQIFGTENTIYCRDIAFITERLTNAPVVKILGEMI